MGMMTAPKDPTDVSTAFENAISRGAFTKSGAGDYMFMYRNGGNDYFKNIISREYITIPSFSGYK